MRGLLSGVDWIRTLNPDRLPEAGMTVATVGRFTLVLFRGWHFCLKTKQDTNDLSVRDLEDLRELLETYHEWATVHKSERTEAP